MNIKFNKENKSYAIKIIAEENGEILGRAYLYVMFNGLHEEPFGFLEDVFVEEKNRYPGWQASKTSEIVKVSGLF